MADDDAAAFTETVRARPLRAFGTASVLQQTPGAVRGESTVATDIARANV